VEVISMNVEQFLQRRDVDFDLIPHPNAFDASHLAQTLHVPGRNVAKTVLLKADHGFRHFVAVLPATKRVSLEQLSRCLGDSHLELATEDEVAEHCPDCEVGVLPPFGSQYGLNTVMDQSLSDDAEMVFEANNHHEAIRMKVSDFRYIEQPLVCSFAR